MNIQTFFANLRNFEKTRNTNHFKDYSLDLFMNALIEFGLWENPVRKNKFNNRPIRISIIGTNGKGTISYFLSQLALLSKLFQKVGLYTSPHLLSQNERIQVNGYVIKDEWLNDKLIELIQKKPSLLNTLSFFENFTLFAILYFKEFKCDLEIYEAGLGGRLDATKLTNPEIVVLGSIGLEHTEILGDTEEKILLEKLEISNARTHSLFHFLKTKKLRSIIKEYCFERKIKCYEFQEPFQGNYLEFNRLYSIFIFNKLCKKYKLNPISIVDPKILATLPGRMEIISSSPFIIYDVAHNIQAIESLMNSIQIKYPSYKWNIIFACMKDKDALSMVNYLLTNKNVIQLILIQSPEFQEIELSHEKIVRCVFDNLNNMIQESNNYLVCGSFKLYNRFVGKFMK